MNSKNFLAAAWMKEKCSAGDEKAHGTFTFCNSSQGIIKADFGLPFLFFYTADEELWSEADSSCSGQPIHLWQFLRELLLKPHNYGRCIRWLNKEKGTFCFFPYFYCLEDSMHFK